MRSVAPVTERGWGDNTVHDGRTKKVEIEFHDQRGDFLARNCATLIMVSGHAAGMEWTLEGARSVAGRSPKAAIELDDRSVSVEHAAFELGADGFGVRDLASTNGVLVNGKATLSSGLQHGDRIRLGDCELQYVVEAKPGKATAWSVEEGA
jgi:predicted component of type VI protein secretion system